VDAGASVREKDCDSFVGPDGAADAVAGGKDRSSQATDMDDATIAIAKRGTFMCPRIDHKPLLTWTLQKWVYGGTVSRRRTKSFICADLERRERRTRRG